MAASSCTCFTFTKSDLILQNTTANYKNGSRECSFHPRNNYLQLVQATRTSHKGSKKDLFVRNATPEAAGDLVSSLSVPDSLSADNPLFAGIAGFLVTVPFIIQRLLTLTKQVDAAAETVEKIADSVGKVAEEVDKATEDLAEALPEGALKQVVSFVEDLAEETVKDAQKVENLMDKVEELDDKLDNILKNQSKGTEKA